mmetsp:Transcript_103882/g.290914  ORF Transcript_103882/g.290914 Transcript_103882/m.290914 type:complete len:216 (+) Transcript_103882:259-906(+)
MSNQWQNAPINAPPSKDSISWASSRGIKRGTTWVKSLAEVVAEPRRRTPSEGRNFSTMLRMAAGPMASSAPSRRPCNCAYADDGPMSCHGGSESSPALERATRRPCGTWTSPMSLAMSTPCVSAIFTSFPTSRRLLRVLGMSTPNLAKTPRKSSYDICLSFPNQGICCKRANSMWCNVRARSPSSNTSRPLRCSSTAALGRTLTSSRQIWRLDNA